MACCAPPTLAGLKAGLRSSYCLDVVFIAALLLLAGLGQIIPLYCRPFSPDDSTISYPYATHETVPFWLCLVLAMPVALAMSLLPFKFRVTDRSWLLFCLVLAESLALTSAITEVLKPVCGRLRPDYLARLKRANVTVAEAAECKADTTLLRDGRLSFPSGHSSTSFASMTPISLLYVGRSGLFRPTAARLWKAVLCLLPLTLALWVAISRTRDYRHNFDDIAVGSLIGILTGSVAYFMHFPPLTHADAAIAYVRTVPKPPTNQPADLSDCSLPEPV